MSNARSSPRRLLVLLGAVAGSLVVLVVLLSALVGSSAVTRRAVDLVLPSVSRALGREVTLKGAKLRLFPRARVELAGLAVAGRAGEPALVEAESLDVQVGLWPLLRSLGKDVEVRAFTLVRPSVNLVRARDGTWNTEGLGQRPGAGAGAPGKEAPPAGEKPPAQGGGTRVAVDRVRVEKGAVRMIDRTLGDAAPGVAVKDLDLEARGVGPGLPFEASLAAALADERQNLRAHLSVAKLPAGVPQAPADWPEVKGSVRLSALALDRIRSLFPAAAAAIVRGGTASLDAQLTTARSTGSGQAAGPSYRVDGGGDLRDVKLRGQGAAGRFRAQAGWSPARPDAARLDVTQLALQGPGVDLGGTISVETAPVRATFALAGPLLDLDAVMGVLPDAPAPPAKAQAPAPAPGGEVVPEAARRQLGDATAHGTIAVDELRGGHLEATNVKARATLSRGTLTLDRMDAAVLGGRVSATGTQVSLAEKVPRWKLAAKLAGVDLGQGIAAFSGRSPLLAKVNGDLQVSGTGTDWKTIQRAVTGLAALLVKDGTLATTDLGDTVLGALSRGLAAAGKGGLAKDVSGMRSGKTTLKDLSGKFTIRDGFLSASSPLKFTSEVGTVALGGRIALDGRLDLAGSVLVPREVLAGVLSGLPLPETLEIPLSLGGTLDQPSIGIRPDDAARALLRGQTDQARKAAQGELQRAARRGASGLLDRLGGKQ